LKPNGGGNQAVARSAGGCTVYLTQTREAMRRVLGNSDTTDALLANLQAKFFCQNTGDTNEWASKSTSNASSSGAKSAKASRCRRGQFGSGATGRAKTGSFLLGMAFHDGQLPASCVHCVRETIDSGCL
jgi:hypothetical protein